MDYEVRATTSRPEERGGGRPFVLAAFFDGQPTDGGGYVHKLGTLRVLSAMQGAALDVVVICDSAGALKVATQHGLRGVVQPRRGWRRILGELSGMRFVKIYLGRALGPRLSPVDRLLGKLKVDLVLFASPDRRAMQLYRHSYILTILDLAHIEHPEFPELSMYGEFERREQLLREAARKATAIFADSEPARRLITMHYGVPESRVFAAPFLMSYSLKGFKADSEVRAAIRKRYGLAEHYIFYPAQFWPHKNHKYILAGLHLMRQRHGWAPQAVFCGSDKGMLQRVLAFARRLAVHDLVRYCGFVPDADIPYLYSGAMALVMPTYCGPNNIPPMEARSLGVPVCYSDLPAFREHMGSSVRYVDLKDPMSLADALVSIHDESSLHRDSGVEELADLLIAAESQYRQILGEVLTRFRTKILV